MRIMIVDDDYPSLKGLYAALKYQGGHQCHSFQDPTQALEAYQAESFDIVVSDVRMPNMSGLELLKRIRDLNPEACVVLVTGFDDLEAIRQAQRLGASAIFRKPVRSKRLLETLDRLRENNDSTPALIITDEAVEEQVSESDEN
jgi:DNA-binding NtrC family response regulator